MNVTRTIKINLSKDEIAEIIKVHLAKEGFAIDTEDINFELESKWYGYGRDEHEVREFSGCSVSCRLNTNIK